MSRSRVLSQIIQVRSGRLAATAVLSTAALLSAAACSGQSTASTVHVANGATSTATAAGASPAALSVPAGTATTSSAKSAPSSAADAAAGTPSCGNSDLQVKWGYGSQSQPDQYSAIDFANISDRTCTLYGYPGLSITVNGTVINATRTLSGTQPAIKSPQLVTLAPGGKAYAIAQWVLATPGKACYPTGTGSFDAIAPNTTHTFVLSTGVSVGSSGICSGLAINPVQPGTFGTTSS